MSTWAPPFAKLTDARSRSGRVKPTASKASKEIVRTVDNLPIRAPAEEYARLAIGQQMVFRRYHPTNNPSHRQDPIITRELDLPRPALLWATRGPTRTVLSTPVILERYEHIPLGAITEDDIRAEGHDSIRAYRSYWSKTRYVALGWRPRDMVNVFQVRLWQDDDQAWLRYWALTALYDERDQ